MGSNYIERKSLVPVIPKYKFDDVATEFLEKYCPEALKKPLPVPILDIAKKKMGLRIVADFHLSEDFSVYGQMCFTSGIVHGGLSFQKADKEQRHNAAVLC